MRRLLPALLLAALAFDAGATLKAGATPPNSLGKDPQFNELRLSDHRGKVVLVLDVLQRAAGDRLVTIAVDVEDPPDVYKRMRRQLKDTPMHFAHDRKGEVAKGWDVSSYPNLYVIDQNGTIESVHVGYGDGSFEAILAHVNDLIAHPPSAKAAALAGK
jgi:peroxiredoxin